MTHEKFEGERTLIRITSANPTNGTENHCTKRSWNCCAVKDFSGATVLRGVAVTAALARTTRTKFFDCRKICDRS